MSTTQNDPSKEEENTSLPTANGVFDSATAGTPAVSATGTNGADGVDATSDTGNAVSATGINGNGLVAQSTRGKAGIFQGDVQVNGFLTSGIITASAPTRNMGDAAINASGVGGSDGVDGRSDTGLGIFGYSPNGVALYGLSDQEGWGLYAQSNTNYAIYAESTYGSAIYGHSPASYAVSGISENGTGVLGLSQSGPGIFGQSISNRAGYFNGSVEVSGPLYKRGGGFLIDHPQDPANKYLVHSFVESPDMKNVYDGVVILDERGEAEVTLPSWFDDLNTDFRYQLTAIGAPAPNLYIAEKIRANRFRIAGGQVGMEVCWQVTGIRVDPWARANRLPVEQDKSEQESGYYLHPEYYDQPDDRNMRRVTIPHLEAVEHATPHLPPTRPRRIPQ